MSIQVSPLGDLLGVTTPGLDESLGIKDGSVVECSHTL
jgi:hypothetical protein